MDKGVSKDWTPEQEERCKRLLAGRLSFAKRHLIMTMRDLLKYDGRTKQAKRAIAQGKLRLAAATDEDLEELAQLEAQMQGGGGSASIPDTLENYKRLRAEIKKKGIKKEELQCR